MQNLISRLFGKNNSQRFITIVSGLPRSGTSLMMKLLEAGGMEPVTDNIRTADDDNPKGYYEFERVKKLSKGDVAWLSEAQGKVVKIIATLVPHMPANYQYRIIFMRRAMPEILASQRKMLINRGEDPDKVSDQQIAALFEKHLKDVGVWMDSQPNVQKIDVDYSQIVEHPAPQILRINQFLGGILNVDGIEQVIDQNLYRHRVSEIKQS